MRKFLLLGLIISMPFTAYGESDRAKETATFLQTPPQEVYSAYRNYREHLDYLYLLKDVPVVTVPKLLPLKSQVLEVHPSFVTQVVLPPGNRIVKAFTSMPVKFFRTIDNTLLIEPSKEASEGNLIVYYETESGEKETLNLILKVYDPTNSHREPFYTQFVLTDGSPHSPAEVLEKYYSVYHHYPERPYEFFRWDGITYLIQRSSVYGTLKAGRYKYLVTPTVLRE